MLSLVKVTIEVPDYTDHLMICMHLFETYKRIFFSSSKKPRHMLLLPVAIWDELSLSVIKY